MRKFIRLREVNDNEGEAWNWWLQFDGNKLEVHKLSRLLDEADAACDWELSYDLTPDIEYESVVDKLVTYAERGYYASHNKVTGKFTCPDDLGEDAERLYKGGIVDLFKRDT